MNKLIVDFTVSETATPELNGYAVFDTVKARPTATVSSLPRCFCGSDTYALASEIAANTIKGMPASRMFECIGCGEYRLG